MRLSPDIRGAFSKLVKKNLTVTRIAELFDTTRQTVHRWLNRAKHVGREYYKDRPRKPKESKVTFEVELSILKLRTTFKWGTARIQQGLYNLPSFILDSVRRVQGVRLSRQTINNILARNNQNGYLTEFKRWKFFRASEPDELWQIDFKDHLRKFPEWLKGKVNEYKDWFNHSRFHRGVKAFPIDLYECNVRKLT